MLSYEAGAPDEWLAVAGAGRLLIVRRDGASSSIATLWTGLNTSDGVQRVLDELTSAGLSQTPAFALLTWEGSLAEEPVALRAIVRGDVTLCLTTATGQTEVTGRGISTWIEQSFGAASAFLVECGQPAPASGSAPALPLLAGAVWARRVSGAMDVTRGAGHIPIPIPVPIPIPIPGPVVVAPEAVPIARGPEGVPLAIAEDTILKVPVVRIDDAPEPTPAPAADASVAEGYDQLFGVTMMRGVDQAAVRAPEADDALAESWQPTIELPGDLAGVNPWVAEPVQAVHTGPVTIVHADTAADTAADADADAVAVAVVETDPDNHDGYTIMSGDIQKLRHSRKRLGRSAATSAPATAGLYLLLPNGIREPLTQPVLFGRSPSVNKVSGSQVPKLVSLGGVDQDISRNHAQFVVEGDTVVVTDLHSRNGTIIVLPGKSPQKLRQGEPTSVIPGTVVDLGSGITITVCEG